MNPLQTELGEEVGRYPRDSGFSLLQTFSEKARGLFQQMALVPRETSLFIGVK